MQVEAEPTELPFPITRGSDPQKERLEMSYRTKVDEATTNLDFKNNEYVVQLETTNGVIRLKLNPDLAPEHCRNMIGLARVGFYDNVIFHRIIEGFMIQGGCPEGKGTGGPGYRIKAEFNATPHKPGVLSMARSSDPNSAGSQFFICVANAPHLDRQYTAFGVTADDESLKNVLAIGKVRTGAGDRPLKPVVINKATVIETPKKV